MRQERVPQPVALCSCAIAIVAALSGCTSAPRSPEPRLERPPPSPKVAAARAEAARSPTPALRAPRGGGYYLDDGPGESPPPDLESIPEPVPQLEPLHRGAMRPYVVLGQSFTPMAELQPYKARGIATWYGRRYHGKQTSNGEIYDMYAISAAHPTLPLPSYARVTNLATGKSIVVRVNDRGPFLDGRLIDLSYTAAHRLGVLAGGSALVEVESIIPDGSAPAMAYAAGPPSRSNVALPQPGAPVGQSLAAPPPNPYAGPADPILAIAARDLSGTTAPSASPPTAPAQPVPPLGPVASAGSGGGVYLQLGAFGSRENAESFLERARVQFDWLAERLQVRAREGLFRVHAGPYANATEARAAADRIAAILGNRPLVTR